MQEETISKGTNSNNMYHVYIFILSVLELHRYRLYNNTFIHCHSVSSV
jgi:hypothetical protein